MDGTAFLRRRRSATTRPEPGGALYRPAGASLARRMGAAPPSPSPPLRLRGRTGPAQRSKHRAAALTPAPSAPRSTIATSYRRRELGPLLDEIDGLIAQGVRYLYFIDEIFLPQRPLLEALAERDVAFGVQTRIDLWKPEMIELLGHAGCVSIEAGVESLTEEGRDWLGKKCRMSTDELSERLILARRHVPFVQANLIATAGRRSGAGRALARAPARRRRVGERSGAALSVPKLAGLPAALGRAGRTRLGAGARALSRAVPAFQRHPGTGAIAACRSWRAECLPALTPGRPARVLLTTDAVGGVWTYTIDLARGSRGSRHRTGHRRARPASDGGAGAASRREIRLAHGRDRLAARLDGANAGRDLVRSGGTGRHCSRDPR